MVPSGFSGAGKFLSPSDVTELVMQHNTSLMHMRVLVSTQLLHNWPSESAVHAIMKGAEYSRVIIRDYVTGVCTYLLLITIYGVLLLLKKKN